MIDVAKFALYYFPYTRKGNKNESHPALHQAACRPHMVECALVFAHTPTHGNPLANMAAVLERAQSRDDQYAWLASGRDRLSLFCEHVRFAHHQSGNDRCEKRHARAVEKDIT